MIYDLINTHEFSADSRLFFVYLTSGGSAVAVWVPRYNDLDSALEEAAGYAREQGWNGAFVDIGPAELADARRDLADEGNSTPTEEQLHDHATADLTYTESGYLSWEWSGEELMRNDPRYQQFILATRAGVPWTQVEIHEDRKPTGQWGADHAWVAHAIAQLAAVCGAEPLTPIAEHPRFRPRNVVLRPQNPDRALLNDLYMDDPVWVLNLACWPGMRPAMLKTIAAIQADLHQLGARTSLVEREPVSNEEVELWMPESGQRDWELVGYPLLAEYVLGVEWSRFGLRNAGLLIRVLDASTDEEQFFEPEAEAE